ncbi:hypothetical protein chiPu_0019843 [Chiloscyllium punctatum]|uniref:Ig-like domain-containing protein n=1 Tax=Chiloscyllium punctatum TaxID=137246 RepID=A0A401RTA2_CHIPU|nr:hypothetical protein [Chiloscyllium punctatum]
MGFEAVLNTFTALLVFLALDLQGACADVLISQTPSILTVKEGADVHVNCSLDTPQQIAEAFFEWANEDDTILSCKMQNYSHIENCRHHRISASINWNSGLFMLHINSTQLKDNGTYYCHLQIERPVPIKTGRGNGTVLIVEASGIPFGVRDPLGRVRGF